VEPPDGSAAQVEALARDRAIRFIEYRARSKGETLQRLMQWGYNGDVCSHVVADLESCGLLDDREFAGIFIAEMLRKGFGFYRIRGELIKKKLDRELVEEVLCEYPVDNELERAADLAGTIMAKIGNDNSTATRRKIIGHLIRRGYSRDTAQEACKLAFNVDTQIGPE
jgi:regulatory protein